MHGQSSSSDATHVALLHGVVGSEHDAKQLADAVLEVPGIRAVDSWLHVGLGAGDTRPSKGRSVPHLSDAHRRLVESAIRSGVRATDVIPRARAEAVVEGVPATLRGLVPEGSRGVAAVLPQGLRDLWAQSAPS